MAIYEGRWLCIQCGSENLGRYEECNGLDGQNGCGKPRAKDVEFYLPENSPIVTDKNQLADAGLGQDWYCSHCEGANKNAYGGRKTIACVHCGNERERSDTDHKVITYANDSVPQKPVSLGADISALAIKDSAEQTRGRSALYFASGSGVLLIFFAIWYFFFASVVLTAQADSFSWSRSISIQKYKTIQEAGWHEPSDAKRISSEKRIHHYDKVFSHYIDKTRLVQKSVKTGTESYKCGTRSLGNGYFEDITCNRDVYSYVPDTERYQDPVYNDVPVFGTWYIYNVDRWVYDRTHELKEAGQEARWPLYQLANQNERVSDKKEFYKLYVKTDAGVVYDRELVFTEWQKVKRGQRFTLEVSRAGSVLSFKVFGSE